MPFKSKSQQRFMFAAEARGELKKGTAKRWAHHTKNIKKLPERVKKATADVDVNPDLPPTVDPASVPWTKGFAKAAAANALRMSNLIANAGKAQSLAGSTDAALRRYNHSVVSKMIRAGNPIKEAIKPDSKSLVQGFKNQAKTLVKKAENLAEKAHEQSNWNVGDYVPGEQARENMETAQAKGKPRRTEGVQNEDKQFSSKFKQKAQTARGGKHYGGTIREGV